METVGTVTNGRTAAGKFAPGNRAAAGHKHRQHVAKLRRAFTEALEPSDILNVVAKLLELAASGDVAAIRLLLDRALGRVQPPESFTEDDSELDREIEVQRIAGELRAAAPHQALEFIQQKAEFLLRIQEMPEDQQAILKQRIQEHMAMKAANAAASAGGES